MIMSRDSVVLRVRAISSVEHPQNSEQDSSQMLVQKNAILRALEQDLSIKNNTLNNASLVPISTYHSMIPKFQNLLDSLNGNFGSFYNEVELLSKQNE